MPRLPRLHVPGGFYHVMLRGNHRANLFSTDADHEELSKIVALVIDKLNARVHMYCWMTNHIHLAIQIGEHPLGKVMQRVAVRYSRYRHKQMHTTGHLFEKRYKAKLVEADSYFYSLLRYIHFDSTVPVGVASFWRTPLKLRYQLTRITSCQRGRRLDAISSLTILSKHIKKNSV